MRRTKSDMTERERERERERESAREREKLNTHLAKLFAQELHFGSGTLKLVGEFISTVLRGL